MYKIIRDPIEMELFSAAWNRLADRAKNPLLRYEWFASCVEAFYSPDQMHILIQRSSGSIDAIAPLSLLMHKGITTFDLLGTSFLAEPSGFLYHDIQSLENLFDRIIALGRPVVLKRLSCESPEISLLHRLNGHRTRCILRQSSSAPYIRITAPWHEFESGISSRRRYDLRRAKKKAERLGRLSVDIVNPDVSMLDHYLNEIFSVEAAGWKGRAKTAMMFDDRLKCFFRSYALAACRLGTLRLCFLRIDGRPIAIVFAIECYKKFWVLKIGYDELYSDCSPGILLIHNTIRYAHELGLEAYEFLGSEERWIQTWTKQNHSFITAYVYPFSLYGRVGLGLDIASFIAKKTYYLFDSYRHRPS